MHRLIVATALLALIACGGGEDPTDSCDPGFFGPNCVACDCGGGFCDDGVDGTGACNCPPNFAGERCEGCADGYYGGGCLGCDCANGVCDDGLFGSGSCTCEAGWDGARCDACDPGHFGLTCARCSCQNGTCSDGRSGTGQCQCEDGWAGPACDRCATGHYGDNCLACLCANGACDGAGLCQCDPGWGGDLCDTCAPGFWGADCRPCTCVNGTCDDGLNGTGTCDCGGVYAGSRCEGCANGYYGTACDPCDCGAGECDDGFLGTGACTCPDNWTGAACDTCAEGTYGAECSPCTCVNGTCDEGVTGSGACDCPEGFTGTTCDRCLADHYGAACTPCDCHGRGTCDAGIDGTGQCTCTATGWTGADCNSCEPGRYGPICDLCTCFNGTCDEGRTGDGSCDCAEGWGGLLCDECAPSYGGDQCQFRLYLAPLADVVAGNDIDVDAATEGALRFNWEQVSGPGTLTFTPDDAEDTSISADRAGVYEVRLTIENDDLPAVEATFTYTRDVGGELDSTYGDSGTLAIDSGGVDRPALLLPRAGGGHYLACTYNNDLAVLALTAEGTVDAAFGTGGIASAGVGSAVTAVDAVFDNLGDLMLLGNDAGAAQTQVHIARISAAGAVDTDFGTAGSTTLTLGTGVVFGGIVVDGLNRAVVGGSYIDAEDTTRAAVVRLDSNGNLDPGYGDSGLFHPTDVGHLGDLVYNPGSGGVTAIAHLEGQNTRLLRVTANGEFDSGFGDGGISVFPWPIREPRFVPTPSGWFVPGDLATEGVGSKAVVALTPTFDIDSSFATDGLWHSPEATGRSVGRQLSFDSLGRIYLSGDTAQVDPDCCNTAIWWRLGPDGEPDPSFGSNGQFSAAADTTGAMAPVEDPTGGVYIIHQATDDIVVHRLR